MLQRSNIVSSEAEMKAYYEELGALDLKASWANPAPATSDGPKSRVQPYRWRWRDLRPEALRALQLVGTQQAERRVIRCVNPGLDGTATKTMVANIQIVGPGEIARAHRHTPAALRMIIESTGGYTVVNGEVIPMQEGDLVLTPNWTWHDHANDAQTPIIWLDGLDSPLVNFFETRFQEEYPEETQTAREDVDSSFLKYGAASVRPAWEAPAGEYSPQMHYPWSQIRDTLDKLAESETGSPHDGVIVEYSNPMTGGPVMPTIRLLCSGATARQENGTAPAHIEHRLPRCRRPGRHDHRWDSLRLGPQGRNRCAGLGVPSSHQRLGHSAGLSL
jgi:gentisate 1,2-dioxygenase